MPRKTSLFSLGRQYIYLKLLQTSQIDYCQLQNACWRGSFAEGVVGQ